MRDWAINYILHVLEQKDWSANRLATEAGVASSTIARPLRTPDWPHQISRKVINRIAQASGIDPAPFIPAALAEPASMFSAPPTGAAARGQRILDATSSDTPTALARNEIKIAVVGPLAQIVATVDRAGLAKLRTKLDAIESMLDD